MVQVKHHDSTAERDWNATSTWRRTAAALPSAITLVAVAYTLLSGGIHTDLRQIAGDTLLAVLYLVAYRTTFEATIGASVPTQPVLLALVLAAPLHAVPCIVLASVLVGSWLDGKRTTRSLLLESANAFHSLAFPLVLWGVRDGAGVAQPSWSLLTAAIVLQFVLDGMSGYLIERPAHTPARLLVEPIAWTWSFDALMSVIGWAMVTASPGNRLLLAALVTAPILLVLFFSRDRETYLAQSLAMHDAYAEADAAARIDPMTGVVNRLGWERALEHAQAQLADASTPQTCTVLCADLDRLKLANDHFGHEVGDRLITELATILRECAPADATVARLGGDEFAVLAVAPVRRGEVDLLGPVREAILNHRAGLPVQLSASLGQAHVRASAPITQALLEADEAARLDKAARRMSRDSVAPDLTPGTPGARGRGSANGIRVFVP